MDEQVVRWPEQSIVSGSARVSSRPQNVGLNKLSDAELMDRLSRGEQEALSYLFDRYHRLVLRIASKLVHDRAEAEDLMQEVFFEVYRYAERFDPAKGTAKGWIVQFTYHKSLNRRKYLALRGAFEDRQTEEFDLADAYPPYGNNGHFSEDVLATVQKGLSTLPSRQREAVELACIEGLTMREISARTRESLGNVRHHYYRGIAKLREFVNGRSRRDTEGATKRLEVER